MNYQNVTDRLKSYIGNEFLGPDKAALQLDTPLLEWGILNSMNIAKLMNFVREEIGVSIPMHTLTGKNFRSIKTISDLVMEQEKDAVGE